MNWIIANIGTVIVALVIVAIVAGAIIKLRKDKRAGRSCSCGCGCSGCALKGKCRGEKA